MNTTIFKYTGTTLRVIFYLIQLVLLIMKVAIPNSIVYKWSWFIVFIPLWISLALFFCWFYSYCFSEYCLVGYVEKGNSVTIKLPPIKVNKIYALNEIYDNI